MSQSQARDPFLQVLQATPFAIDRKRLAAQQIYDDLRERIIGLDLKPGTGLSRPALTEFYRVSQTPIRDAILKLEQEGLVEIYPQSKTLVARIDVADAKETQFLRTAIELEVARALALDGDKMKLAPARRLLDQQREAIARGDLGGFIHLDRQFHASLAAASGHGGLWDLIRTRSGHLDRLRQLHLPSPGKGQAILADHREILTAIDGGHEEAARKAVRKHLSGTLRAIDQIVAKHPGYF
ncbi:GntR family transcriptional regulator [Pelagibius sp. 7325]|uniref:GntR family transcriptional regulator n=1 Tax=Pelagibius sp. 7325 TaxID=3131994 RepID=UPI0030EC1CF0